MSGNSGVVHRVVRSELFTLAARAAMVIATFIFLPIAGAIGLEMLAAAKSLIVQVQTIDKKLELLSLGVKFGLEKADTMAADTKILLTDHETRIRRLEAIPRK